MSAQDRAKRFIGSFYSGAASKIYEPLIVHGTFPLLAGKMPELVREQGRRAILSAAGGPILDVPIGTAYYTVPTAREHRGLVVGADFARGMVERSQKVARLKGAHNIHLVQADIHHLPFPDDSFRAILCTNGLQVIPGLEPSLSELARVLAPGSTLFVSVITLPATRVLAAGKPRATWLRAGEQIAEAIADTGLGVRSLKRSRFATLIEATKGQPARVSFSP